MEDPVGTDWRAAGDPRRLAFLAAAASALCADHEAMLRARPPDDSALQVMFETHAHRWTVLSAAPAAALDGACACGARSGGTLFRLENKDTWSTLDLDLDCLKRFNQPPLMAQAKAHVKNAKLLAAATAARAAAICAASVSAPAPYPAAVLARARDNGWLTRAAVSGYGTSRAATAVIHRTMARVLDEGLFLEDARPRQRVYRLCAPCDAGKELGLRYHAGAPHWRGVETCAPADLRNRISAETQLDWDDLAWKNQHGEDAAEEDF